jgi:SEC-C motif
MSVASISRNASCPCGSGKKYKRCCLAGEENAVRDALLDDAVGRRIQEWAAENFDDEIEGALQRYVGPEHRVLYDDDFMLFATWFHNDRQVAGGGTPAERYAARADLTAAEREAASRIATAQLGLYRVLSPEPGRSLLLEGVADGARIEVRSPLVSRGAVRWDILLARVMDGDPPSLWGPVRFFEPCDEPEMRAELERLAGMPVEELDNSGLAATCRRHSFELMQFTPASRSAERSLFTLEGDPVAFASATWRVHDLRAVTEQLTVLGGLLPDDPLELEVTVTRASLVEQRSALPPGAVIVEATRVDAPDTVPIATLRLEGGELQAEAISEPRLDYAIDVVTVDLGLFVEFVERNVTSADEALRARRADLREASPAFPSLLDDGECRLLGDLVTDRMHGWLDEPHPLLAGRTPREAAAGPGRAEVVRLIRQLENGAERARRRGEPAADVARLRRELELSDEFAA